MSVVCPLEHDDLVATREAASHATADIVASVPELTKRAGRCSGTVRFTSSAADLRLRRGPEAHPAARGTADGADDGGFA